jgi:hypothetical protein
MMLTIKIKNIKLSLLTGHGGLDSWFTYGSLVVSLKRRPHFTPRKILRYLFTQ